jgi:hypothetical protein
MGYVVPDLDAAMQYWLEAMGVGPFFTETHDLPSMLELIERGPFIEQKIATIKAASIGWDGSNPIRSLRLNRP